MKKFIGWSLLASPFVAVTAFLVVDGGIMTAAIVWGLVAVTVGVIWAGAELTQ